MIRAVKEDMGLQCLTYTKKREFRIFGGLLKKFCILGFRILIMQGMMLCILLFNLEARKLRISKVTDYLRKDQKAEKTQ